jgi:hypothetical protein
VLKLLHSANGCCFWDSKSDGHAGFGLFSLLLPIFFSSPSLLLCSAFFFPFFFFSQWRTETLLFSAFFFSVFGCFFLLFSLCFLFFF